MTQATSLGTFVAVFVFLCSIPFAALAATCPNLYRNLSFGSRGQDVVELQNFLIAEGDLAAGLDTGYFGRLTEGAVKKWQAKQEIVSSGTPATTGYGAVGPRTRAKIASTCGTTAAIKLPTFPSALDAGSPAPPADQALAEITVVSELGGQWSVRFDKY